MRHYFSPLVRSVLAGALVLVGSDANAQITRLGATFPTIASPVRGSGVAFDPVNRVYLTVASNGVVFGRFVTENGAAVGSGHFAIQTSGIHAHFPSVAYSPHADGGTGAFLVAWHETNINDPKWRTNIHARFVSASRGAFGPDVVIGSTGSMSEASVKVDYSMAAQKFMVAWGTDVADVRGAVVTNALAATELVVAGSGDGELKPGVACHTTAAECLVSYSGWGGIGAFAKSVIVNMSSGAVVESSRATHTATAGTYQTDAVFNASTGEYMVLWYADPQGYTFGKRAAANSGATLGNVIPVSTYFAAKDSVDAAYNPASGTSFLMGMGKTTYENGGVEIDGSGNPGPAIGITETGNRAPGNFYPSIGANSSRPEWLAATSVGQASLYAQRLGSGSVSTTPPQPGPTPVPTPVPTDPRTVRERARADFNGDGSYDILWQNVSTGHLAAWTLKGNTLLTSDLLSHRNQDNNWRMVATGDFNGDGKPDIVWQHITEGWVGVWYMNGLTLIDSVYLSINRVLDTGWQIVGAGDFNGDGKTDIAWQHKTQRWLAVWLMNGISVTASELMAPQKIFDARWKIVGVADVNLDMKADLVWRHSETGDIGAWLMNGLSLVDSIAFNPGRLAEKEWEIAGIIDANADGKPDLVWHHVTQGWVGVWYMNGNDLIDSVWLGPGRVPDAAWKVVGPK